jgi:hypothetical protein
VGSWVRWGCALGCISRGAVAAMHKRAEAGRRKAGKRVGADWSKLEQHRQAWAKIRQPEAVGSGLEVPGLKHRGQYISNGVLVQCLYKF